MVNAQHEREVASNKLDSFRKRAIEFKRIKRILRLDEWWGYKLPPALSVAFAITWRLHLPLENLCSRLAFLVLAGIACGAYASVLNDATDLKEDRLAGKTTEMMSLSGIKRSLIVLSATASVLLITVGLVLFHLYLSAACVFCIWTVYTLYSVRPFRLKARGAWGAICIAMGEHALASLLAMCLILEGTSVSVRVPPQTSALFVVSLLIWSLALGFRSIAWHQLCDYENDCKTKTATLGANVGAQHLRKFVERIVFPLEVIGLAVLLWIGSNWLAWAFLGIYGGLELIRKRHFGVNIIIVEPKTNFKFVLLEYYRLLLPLSFLIPLAVESRTGLVWLVAQLVLFPKSAWLFLHNVAYMLSRWRSSIPWSLRKTVALCFAQRSK